MLSYSKVALITILSFWWIMSGRHVFDEYYFL